jgi:hypothetical protein
MKEEVKNKIEQALFDFYMEADKDFITQHLKENNQDTTEYEKKKKQLLFLAKATANKKQNEYLLALASKFEEALRLNIEKPIAMLKQLIQEKPLLALNRNLNKLTKENIIEIIKDKNLVELLEQLESQMKNEND